MTTPAKSDYSETFANAHRDTWSGGSFDPATNLRSVTYEYRPASTTAGRLKRFKLCDSFWHEGKKFTKQDSFCRWTTGDPAIWFEDSGNIFDGTFPDPEMPSSNLKNACLVKALTKLKNQDVHLGNFVAEAHKTLEMFENDARRIAKGVRLFRKKYPKDFELAKRYEGNVQRHDWCLIPNSWLELQYGWKPLMSDLYGSLQHMQKRSRFSNPFVSVHANSSDNVTTVTNSSSISGTVHTLRWNNKQEVNVFLVYGLTSPVLAELSSLGLINPLEIVWETTKYSFVVDWFLPISSWLSALTADVGYTFITGGLSETSRCTFAGSELISTSPYNHYEVLPTPSVVGDSKWFRRSCYASSPVPGLYVKNPLSVLHAANAFALLAQAFN